jgi:hypothetical protein
MLCLDVSEVFNVWFWWRVLFPMSAGSFFYVGLFCVSRSWLFTFNIVLMPCLLRECTLTRNCCWSSCPLFRWRRTGFHIACMPQISRNGVCIRICDQGFVFSRVVSIRRGSLGDSCLRFLDGGVEVAATVKVGRGSNIYTDLVWSACPSREWVLLVRLQTLTRSRLLSIRTLTR